MIEIPEDLLTFKLPKQLVPGGDNLAKIILSEQTVIDGIAKSLIQADAGVYVLDRTEWIDGLRSDMVYSPRLPQLNLPPILLEVQQSVNKDFMSRAVMYCTGAYRRFKVLPIVLVFAVDSVSLSVLDTFKGSTPNYLLETACTHFAKNFYLVSKTTIQDKITESVDTGEDMEMIVALEYFFSSKERSLINLDNSTDPNIIFLYEIAKEQTMYWTQCNDTQIKALHTICAASEEQFSKIHNELTAGTSSNQRKAIKFAQVGMEYHSRLKRKYDDLLNGDTSDEEERMEEPDEVMVAEVDTLMETETLSQEENNFIKKFIDEKNGRMNWTTCYVQGVEKGHFKKYKNGGSLRVVYSRFKPKNTSTSR